MGAGGAGRGRGAEAVVGVTVGVRGAERGVRVREGHAGFTGCQVSTVQPPVVDAACNQRSCYHSKFERPVAADAAGESSSTITSSASLVELTPTTTTEQMTDPAPNMLVKQASDGLTSINEVAVEVIPASTLAKRQSTSKWKMTLDTDTEIHNRADERRQNIVKGHRFFHARRPP